MRTLGKLTAVLLISAYAAAGSTVSTSAQATVPVEITNDAKTTEITGTVVGDGYVDYTLSAMSGQVLSVTLATDNLSVNFNVLPEGNPEAIYIGSIEGPEFVGRLPADGSYTIRVYQLGAAADGGTESEFTLTVGVDAVTMPEQEDALVEGTDFNATGSLPCTFEANPDAPPCAFGVKRDGAGGATVFVTTPSGFVRELVFATDGTVTTPGSDKPVTTTASEGDYVVDINDGEEVYRVPDVVVAGD